MKRLFLFLTVAGLWIAACGPAVTQPPPTATPLPPTPTQMPLPTNPSQPASTPVPPTDLTPAEVAAIDALSEALGVPLDQIKIVSTEAVEWPDACLGMVLPNVMCAQMLTPGFRLRLEANGVQYEYRTNEAGTQVFAASLALTWHREGGIAGFCDDLQVYLSGEVWGSSCKSGETYSPVRLTAEEVEQLLAWLTAFGTVSLETKDPAVADAMTLRLTLNGYGSRQPTEAEQTALFDWAQSLYDKIKP